MNYNKKTVKDIDVKGKKVLLRCDFNVPMAKDGSGVITDDKRIRAALPTIQYLLDQGAAVIACSHMGKPVASFDKWVKKQTEKGKDPASLTEEKWKKSLAELRMEPVAARLGELLGKPVILADDVVGPDAQAKAAALKSGEILLLQNTRFEKGETKNDPEFAKELAALTGADGVYVSDAFGAVHRAHASTAGVAEYLPAVSGFLIQKELDFIGGALANPKRPLVAILGGSKVSSKIGVINNLLEIANTIIIGGGMAYTFSAAQGGKVGDSLLEADWKDYSLEMIQKAKDKGVKLLLPVDTVIADKFAPDADSKVVASGEIPDGWQGLDIGPETVKLYCEAVADAGTVIWNGPMGVFEFDKFAVGTKAVAEALSKTNAITIIGGGDSAAAVQQLGYADKMTHISTGGGASLEFMEGKELPGVACLLDA
ncbi:MAG: phosphoglycerate kinase [Lawsonibacter sp.]|nr:phosphoglycerate kinase [Lawsonibacter sp.]